MVDISVLFLCLLLLKMVVFHSYPIKNHGAPGSRRKNRLAMDIAGARDGATAGHRTWAEQATCREIHLLYIYICHK